MSGKETMDALLEVNNLSIDVCRGEDHLSSVKDISFKIYPGEILGIAGESGSGKSLTALSIAALLGSNKEVSSGSILYRGGDNFEIDEEIFSGVKNTEEPRPVFRNLLALTEKELETVRGREISMVFQETFSALNPLKRVGEQIAETLRIHGIKDKAVIRGRIMKLLPQLRFPEPDSPAIPRISPGYILKLISFTELK
jgi:ABC-type glutathione transport system ATPase component